MAKVNPQGRGHIVAASRTACLKFKHNSNRSTNLVAYTYTALVRAHASTPYSKVLCPCSLSTAKLHPPIRLRQSFQIEHLPRYKLLFCKYKIHFMKVSKMQNNKVSVIAVRQLGVCLTSVCSVHRA